jgi:hypothetical protein
MANTLVIEVPDGVDITEMGFVLSGVLGRVGQCLTCRSSRDIIFAETVASLGIDPAQADVFRYDSKTGTLIESK